MKRFEKIANGILLPINWTKSIICSNEYGNRLMTDLAYRAKISLYMSLSMNVLYAVFKLLAGIHYASFWFGADALFYIVLSVIRFLLLRHMRKERPDIRKKMKIYRFSGCLLFLLNIAFAAVVYQVVRQDMGYSYPGLLIYAAATYAFSCLAASIVNLIKYRKLNNPVLSAAKAINLAKALVAIFALQTALLISFGGDDSELFKSLMKSLTGGGVCLFVFGMAVYMILRANKMLKKETAL